LLIISEYKLISRLSKQESHQGAP